MNLIDKLTALKGIFLDMLLQKTGVHPVFIAELRAQGSACSNPFRKKKLAEVNGEPQEGDGDEGDGDDEPMPDDDDDIDSKYEARDGVKIYGVILSEQYAWLFRLFKVECCTAEQVRRDLKKRVTGNTATLYIDSFGGSVIEAGKIRSALAEWRDAEKGRTIVSRIEGAAISAAASIMVIGDTITADSQCLIGLHVPIVDAYGSAETHRKTAALLDSILDAECRLFAKRMKMRPAGIAAKMREGLDEVWWMAAHEAQKGGLVDSVIGLDGDEGDGDDGDGNDDPPPDDNGDPAPQDGEEGDKDKDKDDPDMDGSDPQPTSQAEQPEGEPAGDGNPDDAEARRRSVIAQTSIT